MEEDIQELILSGVFCQSELLLNTESQICLFLLCYWEALTEYERKLPFSVRLAISKFENSSSETLPSLEFKNFSVTSVFIKGLPWHLQQTVLPIYQCGIKIHCGICAVGRALVQAFDRYTPGCGFLKLLVGNNIFSLNI